MKNLSLCSTIIELADADSSSSASMNSSNLLPPSSSHKHTWKKPQVEKLMLACKNYSLYAGKLLKDLNAKDFLMISSAFTQTTTQCIIKFREIIASGTLKAGAWSEEEDQILKQSVEEGNKHWGNIAKAINSRVHSGIKVRTGKKCKERWLNFLNPLVKKGEWTTDEDLFLLEEVKKNGRKWKFISDLFENRIESSVKNRFKSLINCERQAIGSIAEDQLIDRAILKAKNKLSLIDVRQ